MKRTQLLDARRNIRKEFVAFISIVMIGMMAAIAFLSVTYSAATLKKDALRFFNDNALWDLEVGSTMLLDEDDLEAVRALDGVTTAESVYQADTRLFLAGGSTANVTVMSLPESISLPVLLEGRLPETATECAVEKELMDRHGLALGQKIRLDDSAVVGLEPLAEKNFVITGVFQTPDHITYMIPAVPTILVPRDSFDLAALDGAFMKIRLRLDAPEDRYSDAYWAAVSPVEAALEAMSGKRAALRTEKVRSRYDEKLRDGQAELDAAAQDLREAKEKIDSGYRDLEDAAEQLGLTKDELDAGKAQLDDAQAQILAGEIQLQQRKEKLDAMEPLLAYPPLVVLFIITKDDWPTDAKVDYNGFQTALMAGQVDMAWLYENTGYNAGAEKLRQSQAQYEQGRLDWYYLGEEYLDAMTRLEQGRRQVEEGEEELAECQTQYDKAERELQTRQQELDELEDGRWFVLNNKGNAGYVYAQINYEKLASLSMTFSSIFLIVGALVIYATIGRMVEQQRKLIGATKAMGLYNREIFAKYLFFACSATLLGVGIGTFVSWRWLQRVILNSYEALFTYGAGTRSFLLLQSCLVVVGSLLISTAAVYLGCRQLLRLSAIQLMQGVTPSAGRKKARKSARKTLYSRLIALNMLTDLRRVVVTIVSIAGGCLLMVIGFTLRYGISGVTLRQFGEIVTYEADIFYSADANPNAAEEISAILDQYSLPHANVNKQSTVFDGDGLESVTLIVAEPGALDGYYTLRDIDSGAALEPPDSGALVPRRFWEYYGIDIGEDVTVYDTQMSSHLLPVSGVFENYYGQIFFLRPESYEACFGTEAETNCLFVRTNGMSLAELEQKVAGVEGFVRVEDAAAERVIIEQFSGALNFVVWFMLFIAGLMACFIVANFTVTYLQRKTGELTIMRINGFTAGECIRYAAVDLVVTAIIGTLLGLLIGGPLGSRILLVTETQYIQMIRQPVIQSFLYSALITCGFSALTNGVALRRVKRLKLSDISA